VLIGVLAAVFLMSTTSPVRASYCNYEDTSEGNYRESQVKVQATIVYRDELVGYEYYAISLFGEYGSIWPQTIKVFIWLSAHYKVVEYNEKTDRVRTYDYWDPAPSGYVVWAGDMYYDSSVPDQWTWTVGNSTQGISCSRDFRGSASESWGSANGTCGDWRYLGWFQSTASDAHEFSALLTFRAINAEVKKYQDGLYSYTPPIHRYVYIDRIQVETDFQFWYKVPWAWLVEATHFHILGDGTPSDDTIPIEIAIGTAQ